MARQLREQQVEDLELEQLIEDVRTSTAVELALEEAEKYIQRGAELLSLMPDTPEREALVEIARYVVRRNL
jgi:geranylgeranyl pyrophosphate synthase